jgi:hypothetical protein
MHRIVPAVQAERARFVVGEHGPAKAQCGHIRRALGKRRVQLARTAHHLPGAPRSVAPARREEERPMRTCHEDTPGCRFSAGRLSDTSSSSTAPAHRAPSHTHRPTSPVRVRVHTPRCFCRMAATTASFSIGLKAQVLYTMRPPTAVSCTARSSSRICSLHAPRPAPRLSRCQQRYGRPVREGWAIPVQAQAVRRRPPPPNQGILAQCAVAAAPDAHQPGQRGTGRSVRAQPHLHGTSASTRSKSSWRGRPVVCIP